MTTYRKSLPQLGSRLFLTDGGIETTLIFHEGLDLPYFAAFHLLRDPKGRDALVRYYERYIAIAKADGLGFILESPTRTVSVTDGKARSEHIESALTGMVTVNADMPMRSVPRADVTAR
jgi:S-methylmethionine-dependent homocysteine/selenocysteine methylase